MIEVAVQHRYNRERKEQVVEASKEVLCTAESEEALRVGDLEVDRGADSEIPRGVREVGEIERPENELQRDLGCWSRRGRGCRVRVRVGGATDLKLKK